MKKKQSSNYNIPAPELDTIELPDITDQLTTEDLKIFEELPDFEELPELEALPDLEELPELKTIDIKKIIFYDR